MKSEEWMVLMDRIADLADEIDMSDVAPEHLKDSVVKNLRTAAGYGEHVLAIIAVNEVRDRHGA